MPIEKFIPTQTGSVQEYFAIYERWLLSGKRRSTTCEDYWKIFSAFAHLHQCKVPQDVTRKDVLAFRDHLHQCGAHSTTIRRKLGVLKTLFRIAVDYEVIGSNPAEQVRVINPPHPKPRIAFSVEELNRIFNTPLYLERRFPKGAGREAAYWLPLLALFTGARLEELAQLLVDDICHADGLGYYLNITDEAEHAKLKNSSSRRRIPLHAALIQCGFLDYAKSIKSGQLLFSDLKPNPRGKLGAYFSNFFGQYLRKQVGITDRRKVFHSFRHTFKETCRQVGIDEAIHDALTGHSNNSASRKYGNEQYPLAPLFEAINVYAIDGLDVSHLIKTRPPPTEIKPTIFQVISAYYGIVVMMENDKASPIIRANFQGKEALIRVTDNHLCRDALPFSKRILVQAWIEIHKEELLAIWQAKTTSCPIAPLH